MIERHQAVVSQCEQVTLIFDKGNNSEQNIESLDQSPLHFVGSLVPTQHQDLLKIPRSKYQPLNGECFEQVQAYRTRREVFRQERTIVVTFNEDLFDAQVRGARLAVTEETQGTPPTEDPVGQAGEWQSEARP